MVLVAMISNILNNTKLEVGLNLLKTISQETEDLEKQQGIKYIIHFDQFPHLNIKYHKKGGKACSYLFWL